MSAIYGNLAEHYQSSVDAKDYETGRPTYPHEVMTRIMHEHLQNPGNAHSGAGSYTIVEHGAGTGLMTEKVIDAKGDRGPELPNDVIFAIDPSEKLRNAMLSKQSIQEATDKGYLNIVDGTFQNAPEAIKGEQELSGQTDIMIAAQSLHWGTRNDTDFEDTVEETLKSMKRGGSIFAVYNAPVATEGQNSFTAKMNKLLLDYCADDYYKALSSGDWDAFTGEPGKSQIKKFFDTVRRKAQGGKIVEGTIDNETTYDLKTLKSYVMSNAFVQEKIRQSDHNGNYGFKKRLENRIDTLFNKHADENGQVVYGNTTYVIGVTGLGLDI